MTKGKFVHMIIVVTETEIRHQYKKAERGNKHLIAAKPPELHFVFHHQHFEIKSQVHETGAPA